MGYIIPCTKQEIMPIYVDNWTMGTRTGGLYDDDNNCNGPKSLWSHEVPLVVKCFNRGW